MKRTLQTVLTATTVSILTFTALAQDTTTPKVDRPDYARDGASHPHADRLNSAAKASDILGMRVDNYQDEKLGSVDELAVDLESGRIVQVILSTGGFIGVGNRLSAVPPGALHHDAAKNVKIITNNGRVTLRGAVKNAEEKRIIGEIANGIARSENVDNQLEVTLKTTSN